MFVMKKRYYLISLLFIFLGCQTEIDVTDLLPKKPDDIPEVRTLLPDYWIDYFKTKESRLNAALSTLGQHGVAFAYITDIHIGSNNMKSPSILKYLLSLNEE